MRPVPGSVPGDDAREPKGVRKVSPMNTPVPTPCNESPQGSHELRFDSAYHSGRAISIPCDAAGRVDLDALPARLRVAYLGARALVGREYLYPSVRPAH